LRSAAAQSRNSKLAPQKQAQAIDLQKQPVAKFQKVWGARQKMVVMMMIVCCGLPQRNAQLDGDQKPQSL